MKFSEQAEKFLSQGENRKRKPFRFNTLRTYRTALTRVLPLLGDLSLEVIDNGVVKKVGAKLAETLSPKTVSSYVDVIKQVMSSAVDDNGNQLFPRKWNSEFLDLPTIENQKQPTISAQKLQNAISKAGASDKALYALLAGTGLRIAEALALMSGKDEGIGNAWVREQSKIIVRCQRKGGTYDEITVMPTKTKAGIREVDLSPELNDYLKSIFQDAYTHMFPESVGTYRSRLAQNGITEGFHAFRRFRLTHLDSANVPQGLQRFWTGHAAGDVHESYVKSGEKLQERKEWAEKAGLGFKLEAT